MIHLYNLFRVETTNISLQYSTTV